MLDKDKKNKINAWFKKVQKISPDDLVYRQIKRLLQDGIADQVFLPGEILPSEVELARLAGTTRATVRQATNELVAEGVMVREKGKRPRVAMPKMRSQFLDLGGITHYLRRDDSSYKCDVLMAECIPCPKETAELLRIRSQSQVFVLERLRSTQGELFGWEKTWINRSLCPKIDEYDFSCESLYRIFRDVYNIQPSYAEGVLEVLIAERSLAKLFQIREGTPLFSARRTIFTKTHQPIQVNHEIYRGDRYSFDIKVGKL